MIYEGKGKMVKMLPVNEEPNFRTYTQHGFFHSVISSKDKVNQNIEETVAEVSVKGYSLQKWNVQNSQMKYEIDEQNNLKAYTNQWNLGMDLVFWRDCQQNEEIEIVIYKQLYSNVRSSITLFITDPNQEDMTDLEKYDIKLGNSSRDGIYYSTGKVVETEKNINRSPVKPLKLKLIKEGIKIFIEYYDSELQNKKVQIKELEKDCEACRIGFAINLGNSSYYEWMFSNYIQIYSNAVKPMPIEFMWNIHQNWHSYTTNYFMEYRIVAEKEVQESKYSVIEFIEREIDLNRYVELLVNDNLHYEGRENDEPYYHQDLIYGYDSEKERFYMLCYEAGVPKTETMSYSAFLSQSNFLEDRIFYIMYYNPGIEKYVLSRSHILQLFKEYRDCINISYYESEFENVDGYKIGMDCLRYFCTPKGMEQLLGDVRISHLFYERSLCNESRIQYMIAKGMLREEECTEILAIIKEQIKNVDIVRRLAIKDLVGAKITIENLEKRMQRILELEVKFTNLFIQVLES